MAILLTLTLPLTLTLIQGGGHNFFGDELRAALESMTREQRSAFILMQVRPQ